MRINRSDRVDFDIPQDFNMKFIDEEIKFNIYKVIYTYKTARGNKRENHKYTIAADSEDAKFKCIETINNFNRVNTYRAISNVKILDVALLGTVTK